MTATTIYHTGMWWLIGLVLFGISVGFIINNLGVSPFWWITGIVGAILGAGLVLLVPPSLLELQKILATLVMPAALVWLALIAACVMTRAYHRLRWGLLGITAFYTLVGNGWFARGLVASLEAPYTGANPLDCGVFDAVVVLGGGTGRDPSSAPQLGCSGDRLRLAAALYRRGKARKLVALGSSIPGVDARRDLSAETRDLWLQLGIPEDDILCRDEPKNTSQEIELASELCRKRGWDDVGLVTSAWHMRRSRALAARRSWQPSPLPADFRGTLPPFTPLYLIPQGEFLAASHLAAWEYLGALVGR